MAIVCCKGCVAPKRYPGCHGSCSEYLEQKAEHEALKAVADRKKFASQGITMQRNYAISKALRTRKVK